MRRMRFLFRADSLRRFKAKHVNYWQESQAVLLPAAGPGPRARKRDPSPWRFLGQGQAAVTS